MAIKDKAREAASKTKRRIGMERPLAAEEGGRVGIVRGALQSFGQGDMDGFLDALKDDAPFECPTGENFPGAGDHEGPNEVKETFVADAGRTYTSFGFEPELFVDADDQDAVIVLGRFVGDPVEGDSLNTRAVQVWEFKGNSVAAVRIYADSADFPAVISEEEMKKQEEEDRKAEEEESESESDSDEQQPQAQAESGDSDGDSNSDGDSDSDSDSDSDEQPQAQAQAESSESGGDVELARAGDDDAEAEKQEAGSS